MININENKKIKVAVIDSGIDLEDSYFDKYEICNYYNGEIYCNTSTCINNYHGTEVAKILLREAPNIDLVSIQILKENNHCSVLALGEAIKLCITLEVNIINMSLGIINLSGSNQEYLHELCILARKKGIFLFASDHNDETQLAYPANYKEVTGIRTNSKLTDFCLVHFPENNIEFSDDLFYIPDKHKYSIRRGNSYLTAFAVGLFCNYISNPDIKKKYDSFLEYINYFSCKQNIERVFFSKNDENERNMLNGKHVIYFADRMDTNNRHIFAMYSEVCDIQSCYENIFYESDENISNFFKGKEIFFIGALGTDFIMKNKRCLKNIVKLLIKNGKGVITLFPILSVHERNELVFQYGGYIKSIYK